MNSFRWKISLFIAAYCFATACLAGTESSGGGASVCISEHHGDFVAEDCGELLDVNMKRGRVRPQDLEIFKKRLEPKLERLSEVLPDFAAELKEGLQKRWYLTDAKLKDLGALNETEFETRQVAIQNSREVFLNKAWFFSRNEENQEGVLWHELLINIFLKENRFTSAERAARARTDDRGGRLEEPVRSNLAYRGADPAPLTMEGVRSVVAFLLTDGSLDDPKEIQEELLSDGIGAYQTAEAKSTFTSEIKDYVGKLKNFCARNGLESVVPSSYYKNTFAKNYELFKPLYYELMEKQFLAGVPARIRLVGEKNPSAAVMANKFQWQLIAHDVQVSTRQYETSGYFHFNVNKSEDPFAGRTTAQKQLAMVSLCGLYQILYGPQYLGSVIKGN